MTDRDEIADTFDQFLNDDYYGGSAAQSVALARAYCVDEDDAALNRIQCLSSSYWLSLLGGELPDDPEDSCGRRLLHVLLRLGGGDLVGRWYLDRCSQCGEDQPLLSQLMEEAQLDPAQAIGFLAEEIPLLDGGQPTAAGRQVLGYKDSTLSAAIGQLGSVSAREQLASLLVESDPKRVAKLQDELMSGEQPDAIARILLSKDPKRFRKCIVQKAGKQGRTVDRLHLYQALDEAFPGKFEAELLDLSRRILSHGGGNLSDMIWAVEHFGAEVVDEARRQIEYGVLKYEKARWPNDYMLHDARDLLEVVGRCMGEAGRPLLHDYLASKPVLLGQAAATALLAVGSPEDHGRLHQALRDFLREASGDSIRKTLELIEGCEFVDFRDELWKQAGHKSKPVRAALSRYLRQQPDARERAIQLLSERKAAARLTGVEILLALGDEASFELLDTHTEGEKSDEVRDTILLGLEAYWLEQGREMTREDIAKRIDRSLEKLATPPVDWLQASQLPPLRLRGGEELSQEELAYLIFRQSRSKDMRADVEAKPLYALIDRRLSGDFALQVFERFVGSGADAKDRWAMALAGILGDDRLVGPMRRQIDEWAANSRGKLAEYAVQALTLIGSDVALLATDAIAIRYRSKNKNIGKAANVALDAAAEVLGIDRDELGDRIVPWLVFERGQPKVYEAGGRRLELRISSELKPVLWDLDKDKRAANLPKAASDQEKAEFKNFKKTLRDVAKSQLLRVENLLVRQRRWALTRWRDLFEEHPLLRPFAMGLVWGRYADGELVDCFHMLEDGSFTDADDEDVSFADYEEIGIVHPLELEEDALVAWSAHLSDHEIEPPFPQLTRRVVRVAAADRDKRAIRDLERHSLNAMSFRGRAERLGWARGSVVDAGGVTSYVASFPAAGVDVFLCLEEFWIGMSMEDEARLGTVFFVRSGSVQVGSYIYDEPENEKDERVLALAEVPEIVYSEAVGQLEQIAGRTLG